MTEGQGWADVSDANGKRQAIVSEAGATERSAFSKACIKINKYVSVFQMTLSNHLAYVADFLLRSVFLLLILFIFTQLWETTYTVTGKELIAGYTLQTLLWYLVVTEAIMMAIPRIVLKVEQEVKNGDVAYFLNRPLSYIGYHYASYMAEAFIRVSINLFIGGLLIFFLYGAIDWSWSTLPVAYALITGAFTIHFLVAMSISLCAFWIEEVQGYELVYSRMVMILGGMMVPLDVFPDWLEKIAKGLPFQHIVYIPAKHAVGTATESFWQAWLEQWMWIGLFALIAAVIFKMGVKKLNVNGG